MQKILFGVATLTLVAVVGLAAAGAQTTGGSAADQHGETRTIAVQPLDATAGVPGARTLPDAGTFQRANPTGLPAYEMRPDGLMINGLLPANGWEG
jgi:hypothetical protein